MNIHRGFSQDGLNWQIDDDPIRWEFADPELCRGEPCLLSQQTYYECVGAVPNVAYPCATLYDEPTGRIAI